MNKKKAKILMVVENDFPGDIRVRKEACHLSKRFDISILSLNCNKNKFSEKWNDITIYRIPEFPDFRLGKLKYIIEYFYFTIVSSLFLLFMAPFKRYKVVHVHNPPDTLFVLGLLCKIFRIKFVFDHHDLAPNLYLARFKSKKDIIYRIVKQCEKMSCQLADAIIATNESYQCIEQQRHGIGPEKITIVRNNPIIEDCVFADPAHEKKRLVREHGKKVLLFIGAINPQDGVDILLEALHFLIHSLKEKNFITYIVGGGDSLAVSIEKAQELALESYVVFTGMLFDRELIKEYFSIADIGLEPAPKNELNDYSTFIKVMEYMAAGLPIVAFDLNETRYSADGSALYCLPGDVVAFAKNIQKLLHSDALRKELGGAGFARLKNELSWDFAAANLDRVYTELGVESE